MCFTLFNLSREAPDVGLDKAAWVVDEHYVNLLHCHARFK
jgi:hypothetical protein